MRIVLVFAPSFFAWAKEIARVLKKEGAAVAAICTTAQVCERLKADKSLSFERIDDLEALEAAWISAAPESLRRHEKDWGTDMLRRLVIADRQIGGGYVTGGPLPDSALTRMVRADPGTVPRYVAGLMDYVTGLYETLRPDAVLFYAVAGAPALALAEAAPRYGTRFYSFVAARVDARVVMDDSPRGMLAPVRRAFEAIRKNPQEAGGHEGQARVWLDSFRAGLDTMPEYETRNRALLEKSRRPFSILKSAAVEAAKAALYPFVRGQRPLRGESGWQKTWRSLAFPLAGLWHGRAALYPPGAALRQAPYIYYALHYDPEATTMVSAPCHTNQMAVIEALSRAMPLSWRLVVKEHPSMLGRRPRGFYEEIRNIPGVLLAWPYESSLRLVNDAALTATITGTVAWEAMLLGRPALVIGDSPFRAIGEGLTCCSDLTALGPALEKAVAAPRARDETLVAYIAALYRESVDFPQRILWGDPDALTLAAHGDLTDYVAGVLLGRGAKAREAA